VCASTFFFICCSISQSAKDTFSSPDECQTLLQVEKCLPACNALEKKATSAAGATGYPSIKFVPLESTIITSHPKYELYTFLGVLNENGNKIAKRSKTPACLFSHNLYPFSVKPEDVLKVILPILMLLAFLALLLVLKSLTIPPLPKP